MPPSFSKDVVPGTETDAGKVRKLAARVEQTLTWKCLYPDPKQIPVTLISPLNRLGAPPNVQHIHYGILLSFKNTGVIEGNGEDDGNLAMPSRAAAPRSHDSSLQKKVSLSGP